MKPSSLTLPNDPDGEQEFFEWLAEEIGVTVMEARAVFKEELGKFDREGNRIQ